MPMKNPPHWPKITPPLTPGTCCNSTSPQSCRSRSGWRVDSQGCPTVLHLTLDEAHHVGVYLAESSQRIVGRWYERFVRSPSVLLRGVVELTAVSEHRRWRRHTALTLLAPPPLMRSTFPATHSVGLRTP